MSEDNKDLVRRWVEEVFNRRNLDMCEEIIAREYIEHALAPFGHEEPGRVPGPEHMRRTVGWLVDQYPDMRFEIEDLISEHDRVACRIRSVGTNTGALNGVMPPTGKTIDAYQTHWFRIDGGKLAEHWATRDDLTAMLQLGLVAPPGPPQR
ncbi:MAG: ester cyclase [Actinobacteria bacterium]|nr:ester cyclase [Actinomycetota bacterium]